MEFFGTADSFKKNRQNTLYFGLSRRVLFPSTFVQFHQPTSTTSERCVAASFATDDEEHGVIVQLTNQFTDMSVTPKNTTRIHWVPWISPFENEDEHLIFGYHNTILIQNIYIWNYIKSIKQKGWRSLKFEINALNYWCKISMGFAGHKGYNIMFNNEDLKFKKTQHFLAKLIEYELDYFVTIDASKSLDINGDNKGLKYTYDFGDNTRKLTTTQSIVKHQYVEPGVYEVTVTVMDKNGNHSSAKLSQRIFNPLRNSEAKYDEKESNDYNAPYACLLCNADRWITTNREIVFDASKSHDMNKEECVKYIFNMGDGSDQQETQQPIIKYAYSKTGDYCVSVEVFDENGLSSKAQLSLRVEEFNGHKVKMPSIMISSYPTNCDPKAAMKWIPTDGFRYIQQLFHHILITKTGTKVKTADERSEVDFRNIGKEKLIKRLRGYLLENPNEEAKKWRIAASKISQLFTNCVEFVNEKKESYQRKSVSSGKWNLKKDKEQKEKSIFGKS